MTTTQIERWNGDFGRCYTERNTMTTEQVDALWFKNYGTTRTELNRAFLNNLRKDARILEVGCNIGNQLLLLKELGFTHLCGVDVQEHALEIAHSRAKDIDFVQATAFEIPYEDDQFDLVFTSGVLIHIAPDDLPLALDEIHRCSRQYILGSEYYASRPTEICYHGESALLWKMDYANEYLNRHSDLRLVLRRQLPYLSNENEDAMFLLERATP